MKWLFDPEGAFARGMDLVGQLIWLNVLWLVCSLPVVTLGASAAALYRCVQQLQQGEEGHLTRRFFAAWRDNARRATGIWLILLALILLCAADLYFAGGWSIVWRVLAVFGLQLIGMELTFVFPLLARYDNTWRNQMRNALLLAVGHLPRLLLIWLMWAVPVGACVIVGGMAYYLSIVWVLIGYAGLSYFTMRLIWPIFRRMEEE